MAYASLRECLDDLEKNKQLIRIKEEVDPRLEMAAIHLRVYEAGGPALLFEKVKGSRFTAASNIFGTLDRSRYIFRDTIERIKEIISLRKDPLSALKHPVKNSGAALAALKALPLKNPSAKPVMYQQLRITDIPLIQHWPKDGGAFITLPQVYTEDITNPGIQNSNLGMYRIQMTGNDYLANEELGLHYQIHRGIGVHQAKANALGQPLKVSIFVGGPPAHTVAAVMPLPEGLSEMSFAGLLGGRRFRYVYEDGFCVSTDADFVITGEVYPNSNKPEGPFGDHLGYYSLRHPFPVMKVHSVYARKDAIWPFTVVGRPPQEDTSFGALIHELTGEAIAQEIPGLKEVHAVDAAGVHPLLLAVGSERYTPYQQTRQPAELLTLANRILGTGQLSLAKYLFITAGDQQKVSAYNIPEFFDYVLRRVHLQRDLHFYTQTTIDTLDYSGTGLNTGSKVVIAAYGDRLRELCTGIPAELEECNLFGKMRLIVPGIIAFESAPYTSPTQTQADVSAINMELTYKIPQLGNLPLMIWVDDADFTAASFNNFLWVTFTRSNPSHDIHGIDAFVENKHWGSNGPVIIDARIKPHHAPPLEKDPATEARIDRIFAKGGSLYGVES